MAEATPNSASTRKVPADGLDRVYEALKLSLDDLPAAAQEKLAELRDEKTLTVFAVLLVGWAFSHLIGVGELVDGLAMLATALEGLNVVGDLATAVRTAYEATTLAQLDAAAKLFAGVWMRIGIDALVWFIGASIFKKLRAGIEAVRGRLKGALSRVGSLRGKLTQEAPAAKEPAPGARVPKESEIRQEGQRPVEAPEGRSRPGTSTATDAAIALGLKSGATTLANADPWPWLAAGLALLGFLLLLGAGLSMRHGSSGNG